MLKSIAGAWRREAPAPAGRNEAAVWEEVSVYANIIPGSVSVWVVDTAGQSVDRRGRAFVSTCAQSGEPLLHVQQPEKES